MNVSIFTPTHNTSYLDELYFYLKDQDYYEWVVLLNNGASIDGLSLEILKDTRNKFIKYPGDSTKVGALKKYACSQCSGDLLCEVDHDDILVPGAIEELRSTFINNPDASLIYSNTAEFNDDFERSPRFYGAANSINNYDDINGWLYRDFFLEGFNYKEVVSPEPSPYHASLILWQPNHVRAFNKVCYDAVGGYDESLSVLDDSELMCRLYREGSFIHIDKCLYLYRVTGDNTWLKRNKEIQDNMHNIQESNLWHLAATWAQRKDLPILDLGGRFTRIPGALSVDLKDADINTDLNERWPFDDSSVGIVRAYDIVEHLCDIVHTMSELHRVLVPGGYAFIEVPSTDGRGAWQDPTHKSWWNQNSFFYYTRQDQARYIDNTTIRFKDIIMKTYYPSEWHVENKIPYVRAHLMCLKEGYRPRGACYI